MTYVVSSHPYRSEAEYPPVTWTQGTALLVTKHAVGLGQGSGAAPYPSLLVEVS